MARRAIGAIGATGATRPPRDETLGCAKGWPWMYLSTDGKDRSRLVATRLTRLVLNNFTACVYIVRTAAVSREPPQRASRRAWLFRSTSTSEYRQKCYLSFTVLTPIDHRYMYLTCLLWCVVHLKLRIALCVTNKSINLSISLVVRSFEGHAFLGFVATI